MKHPSPLRYPGGKTALTPLLSEVLSINGIDGGVYAEPFAGGAGAALKLLFGEHVSKIFINDLDKRIYSFWQAILFQTDRFIELLDKAPISVKHWRVQKSIFENYQQHSQLDVGFATFYLNRSNRSGVLNGGPIGGINQTGNYKIDARFNKAELKKRVQRIALYRERIEVKNLDGVAFLKWLVEGSTIDMNKCLVYMDPPYFEKAPELYYVYFKDSDHLKLAKYLTRKHIFRWIVSYDNADAIRCMYKDKLNYFSMKYSVRTVRSCQEIIISSSNCVLPKQYFNIEKKGSKLLK